MQKVVGVKKDFDKEIYYFLANENVKVGEKVVVVVDEFQTIGTVKYIIDKPEKFKDLQSIKRIANETDLNKFKELKAKAKSKMPEIKANSLKLGLVMKFIGAEYSLDGSKIVIIFSSEDRVDFRQFLKDLATMLKTRIELKQIGQRDEVKVIGGVGPCGEPCCCARFLKDFEHVSVKMAKTQGLSLSPTKINGICGRLMCCLAYETTQYEETLKRMPKINSEVVSPKGKGIAVYNDILRERVSVKRQGDGDTFIVEDYALEEISFGNHIAKIDKAIKSENKNVNFNKKDKVRGDEQRVDKLEINQVEKFEQKKQFNKQNSSNENLNNKNYNKHENDKFEDKKGELKIENNISESERNLEQSSNNKKHHKNFRFRKNRHKHSQHKDN